ncbi:MAG: CAP domain-containing protein, partial [Patescibacteria group bacterium]
MANKRKKRGSFWKDFFIPHKNNNHQPKALQHKALFFYSACLIGLKVALITAQVILPSASLYSSAINRSNIFELTNASRRNAGLEKLSYSERLNVAAQRKAEDMFVNQYFSHTSPQGLTPWSFIYGAGYDYEVAGENLAVYYHEAEDVLAGWMASPAHKANIIDSRFTEIGIGVATGTFNEYENTVIVVQMFGLPIVEAVEKIPEPTETIAMAEDTEPPVPLEENISVELINLSPNEDGIEVDIDAPEATELNVSLNETNEPLTQNADQTWSGTIETETLADDVDGADLFIQVIKEDKVFTKKIVWVAGSTDARDVYYVDSTSKNHEFFGFFRVNGLEDIVTRFYFLTMVLLAAVLMLNV